MIQNYRHRSAPTPGFTIVELMLSMTFISVMLIAIALCVIQLSTIYTRGETLREVNQASRAITDDLRRTFAQATPSSVVVDKVNASGRLCTGTYSYIWNNVRADGNLKFEHNRYADGAMIRLIRVVDNGAQYCADYNSANPTARSVNSRVSRNTATTRHYSELLQEGNRRLAVHSMTVTAGAEMNLIHQRLYRVSMLLGTESSAAIETTGGDGLRCRAPGSDPQQSDMTYCAVNEISFAVRAGVR